MGLAKQSLTISATLIGCWSLLFSVAQLGLMFWQMPEIQRRREFWDNRPLPSVSGIDPFRSKFPGLYKRYSEAPERRKYLALYIIQICMIIGALVLFLTSLALLYGVRKEKKGPLAIWVLSVIPNVLLSLAYTLIWWTGDVFNEHLTLSILEFVAALLNCVAVGVIILYYMRLSGIPLFGPIHTPPFPTETQAKNLPPPSPKLRSESRNLHTLPTNTFPRAHYQENEKSMATNPMLHTKGSVRPQNQTQKQYYQQQPYTELHRTAANNQPKIPGTLGRPRNGEGETVPRINHRPSQTQGLSDPQRQYVQQYQKPSGQLVVTTGHSDARQGQRQLPAQHNGATAQRPQPRYSGREPQRSRPTAGRTVGQPDSTHHTRQQRPMVNSVV